MKATIIYSMAALLLGFGASYFIFGGHQAPELSGDAPSQQQYTCGMHPEIISSEPGYCPICGMKLTPKKDGSGSAEGSIVIDPTTVQNMGLKTTKASSRPISKSIHTFGKIKYSEPLVQTVNIKISGWVEELFVDYEGAIVKSGQPLLKLYSPELVAAQREYLVALENKQKLSTNSMPGMSYSTRLLDASAMRLQNWDISSEQIQNLAVTGELTKSMIVRSPYDGVVISKTINTGNYLNAGAEAYRIADISEVWAVAYIYEQDIPFIGLGQKANIELPYLPGDVFEAKVSYISPYLDKNRQVEVRLDIYNPDFKLKPEMYAELSFESRIPGNRIALPSKAVINSGKKEIVYIAGTDGSYEPRIVKTGAVGSDDYIEIISGVAEAEEVVVSGQFLLDSESRLNESLDFTHQHSHDDGIQSEQAKSDDKDDHSGHNHDDHSKTKITESNDMPGIYTCPMPEHFHILQYGEGKCADCGMDLVAVEETDNTEVYHCPMAECQTVSNESGRCPKCGMFLKQMDKPEAKSDDAVDHSGHNHGDHLKSEATESAGMSGIYTCPMPRHFHILQYGEGECAECGMDLAAVEETDNSEVYHCPMAECQVVSSEPDSCPKCGMHLTKLQSDKNHD
ncbi:MAG: efflux RND transporter periplasmic adaptor subunit [candidate division Zixibacteria bacterium]|nr:efflux RND transporter periplasmic adaptor subunit [candidate division Zixibacteria bacterium]